MARTLISLMLIAVTWCSHVTSQSTYMRTCECEYVTNGKCAYTLLLPLSSDALPSTCSDHENNATASPDTDDVITRRLDDISETVSTLSDWSSTQIRLLAQVQAAVIGLQNPDLPRDTDVASAIVDEIANLTLAFENLRDSFSVTTDDVDNVMSEVTSSRERISILEGEMIALKAAVSEQNSTISQLKGDLKSAISVMCPRQGLIVSGPEGTVPDVDITASSYFNDDHLPPKGRINNTYTPGAWCPGEPNQDYEYLQFDFGYDRVSYGVITKGRYDWNQWVTAYRVQFAVEDANDVWHNVLDILGHPQVFLANTDRNSPVTNLFWQHVTARYIRVVPLTGNNSNKCMRADVIGCVTENKS